MGNNKINMKEVGDEKIILVIAILGLVGCSNSKKVETNSSPKMVGALRVDSIIAFLISSEILSSLIKI